MQYVLKIERYKNYVANDWQKLSILLKTRGKQNGGKNHDALYVEQNRNHVAIDLE